MDFKLQLQNIADLSNNLAGFCCSSLDDWEENDTDALSEEEKNNEIEYILNTIREQFGAMWKICDVNNKPKISYEGLFNNLKRNENLNDNTKD